MKYKILSIIFLFLTLNSISQSNSIDLSVHSLFCNNDVRVGAENTKTYMSLLNGKRVAVVGNQSSMIGDKHLVDSLIRLGVEVVKVFSPEHGFRGKADAGEKVKSGIDFKTGLPIISLYGNNKKPKPEQMKGIDVLIFDIQDVGVRFYTYISTLHYIMEACSENNVKLIILDRPNPNGHYVDGPVLNPDFKSFVGMHQVPVVHGMSIGEYAKMIHGEKWVSANKLDFIVIECVGWDHTKFYKLPIKPSPNLPNMLSIYLYPSLCFFEGTVVSVGRGTDMPFQISGHPKFKSKFFSFTPKATEGAKYPKLNGKLCYGIDYSTVGLNILQLQGQLSLDWLVSFYQDLNLKGDFFLKNNFINLLAGSDVLQKQLINNLTFKEIRQSWQSDLAKFKVIRSKYLLYKDFN